MAREPLGHDGRPVFVVGPTASGKTEFAWRLAKRLGGEIVSMDAMQLYRGVEILTAQPPEWMRRSVPHHLVGILEFDENWSVIDYAAAAVEAAESCLARGRTPVFVGGNCLYYRALTRGLHAMPEGFEPLRRIFRRRSHLFLRRLLGSFDPGRAAELGRRDSRRMIRSIEIAYLGGRSFSERTKEASAGFFPGWTAVGLRRPRDELYRRIDLRVDEMIREGVLEEVDAWLEWYRRWRRSRPAAPMPFLEQAHGVRQLGGYLEGRWSLEEGVRLMKRDTRRYAKRQLSCFSSFEEIEWYDPGAVDTEALLDVVCESHYRAG